MNGASPVCSLSSYFFRASTARRNKKLREQKFRARWLAPPSPQQLALLPSEERLHLRVLSIVLGRLVGVGRDRSRMLLCGRGLRRRHLVVLLPHLLLLLVRYAALVRLRQSRSGRLSAHAGGRRLRRFAAIHVRDAVAQQRDLYLATADALR